MPFVRHKNTTYCFFKAMSISLSNTYVPFSVLEFSLYPNYLLTNILSVKFLYNLIYITFSSILEKEVSNDVGL
jgi:hypothetical protein